MQVNRHAASVVCHAERAVGMEHNVDLTTVPGEGLIDGVVDHLLRQMIGAGGVGIHTGTLANRLQSSEDLNGVGVIFRHAFSELPIYRCGPAHLYCFQIEPVLTLCELTRKVPRHNQVSSDQH